MHLQETPDIQWFLESVLIALYIIDLGEGVSAMIGYFERYS